MSWENEEIKDTFTGMTSAVWMNITVPFYTSGATDYEIDNEFYKNLRVYVVREGVQYEYTRENAIVDGKFEFQLDSPNWQIRLVVDPTAPLTEILADDVVYIFRDSNTDISRSSFDNYKFEYKTVNELFDDLAFRIQENRKSLEDNGLYPSVFEPSDPLSPFYQLVALVLADIGSNISPTQPSLPAGAGPHDALASQLLAISTVGASVNLPSNPNSGDTVRVSDITGDLNPNISITAPTGTIYGGNGDSNDTTFVIQSKYESVSFISDGTNWIIF